MNDDIFRALSDPIRRKILEMLGSHDMASGEIASNFSISQPSVSRHLSVLKSAGLITDRRDGQRILYSLSTDTLREVVKWFYSSFGNIWIN